MTEKHDGKSGGEKGRGRILILILILVPPPATSLPPPAAHKAASWQRFGSAWSSC